MSMPRIALDFRTRKNALNPIKIDTLNLYLYYISKRYLIIMISQYGKAKLVLFYNSEIKVGSFPKSRWNFRYKNFFDEHVACCKMI